MNIYGFLCVLCTQRVILIELNAFLSIRSLQKKRMVYYWYTNNTYTCTYTKPNNCFSTRYRMDMYSFLHNARACTYVRKRSCVYAVTPAWQHRQYTGNKHTCIYWVKQLLERRSLYKHNVVIVYILN